MVFEKKCSKMFKSVIFRHKNWNKITLVNRKCEILNTYVSLIFHAKIQPKISGSGEEVNFAVFVIFSNSDHLG